MVVSTVLANELYRHNAMYSAGTPEEQEANVIPFVYLVEEAHLMLSREQASEGSVFVNFAKTGRSFQIGLIAVTQRPSSIDTNILSQFDNFVTFRLTNEQDVKDLIKAKSDFRGYEEEIRTMQRGMAVTAFGEPTKVQSIQGFSWTSDRASSLLLENEYQSLKDQHKLIQEE
jgi:DNA helicase HerA-like ATPase